MPRLWLTLEQYEQFWNSPQKTAPAWIAILYAVIGFAAHFYSQSGNRIPISPSEPNDLVELYLERSAQCLIVAGYTSPGSYTLEALIVYIHLECLRKTASLRGIWIIDGILVRQALCMGLHREPERKSHSVFEEEMHRRIWT